MASDHSAVLAREGLVVLIPALSTAGYRVCEPIVRRQATVDDDVTGRDDPPEGWTDAQQASHDRLNKTGDGAHFNCVAGPRFWKKYAYAARQMHWRAGRDDAGLVVHAEGDENETIAFFGLRAGELAPVQRAPVGLQTGA